MKAKFVNEAMQSGYELEVAEIMMSYGLTEVELDMILNDPDVAEEINMAEQRGFGPEKTALYLLQQADEKGLVPNENPSPPMQGVMGEYGDEHPLQNWKEEEADRRWGRDNAGMYDPDEEEEPYDDDMYEAARTQKKTCPECGGNLRTIPKGEYGGGIGIKRCAGCGRSFHPEDLQEGVNESWTYEYGPHEEPSPRMTTTDVFITNGDKKIKVATSSMFIGRDRDTLSWKWDREGVRDAFPQADIERLQDDTVNSGDPRSDWWEPEVQLQKYMNEGVADKYAAQKFGIQDPDDEFEKDFKAHQVSKQNSEVTSIKGKPVYKNPKDLKNMVPGARGVIMPNGDLYVVNDAFDVIHTDLLNALAKKGIVKHGTTGWDDPATLDKFQFATVQRLWNKSAFCVGESYIVPKKFKDPEGFEKVMKLFRPYLDAAKEKNPQYKFIPMQPRTAAREFLSDKEKEEYKKFGA